METSQKSHVVLPVIHVTDHEQALRNAQVAFDAGADGVWLINHQSSGSSLIQIAEECRLHFPKKWLGVNCLDMDACTAITRAADTGLDGVWVDNGLDTYWLDVGALSRHNDELIRATIVSEHLLEVKRTYARLTYFGGVCFKTQAPSKNPKRAANLASDFMDVVTTSGPATAVQADLDKLRLMHEGARKPLAIASGITPENVRQYLPYAKYFLVASGISKGWTELDPEKVSRLVQEVHGQ